MLQTNEPACFKGVPEEIYFKDGQYAYTISCYKSQSMWYWAILFWHWHSSSVGHPSL